MNIIVLIMMVFFIIAALIIGNIISIIYVSCLSVVAFILFKRFKNNKKNYFNYISFLFVLVFVNFTWIYGFPYVDLSEEVLRLKVNQNHYIKFEKTLKRELLGFGAPNNATPSVNIYYCKQNNQCEFVDTSNKITPKYPKVIFNKDNRYLRIDDTYGNQFKRWDIWIDKNKFQLSTYEDIYKSISLNRTLINQAIKEYLPGSFLFDNRDDLLKYYKPFVINSIVYVNPSDYEPKSYYTTSGFNVDFICESDSSVLQFSTPSAPEIGEISHQINNGLYGSVNEDLVNFNYLVRPINNNLDYYKKCFDAKGKNIFDYYDFKIKERSK